MRIADVERANTGWCRVMRVGVARVRGARAMDASRDARAARSVRAEGRDEPRASRGRGTDPG